MKEGKREEFVYIHVNACTCIYTVHVLKYFITCTYMHTDPNKVNNDGRKAIDDSRKLPMAEPYDRVNRLFTLHLTAWSPHAHPNSMW